MNQVFKGGPAFPYVVTENAKMTAHGMTVRDYFAAKALLALFQFEANPYVGTTQQPYDWSDSANVAYARASYALADAMLAARGDA